MAWQDRIKEAAYTSPSGERVVFDYEDVSRTTTKKTTVFDFVSADGSYVQDNGTSGRQYPLRLFIWGEDYDQIAERFERMLSERGVGRLEHPVYGVVDVVPVGDITRRDDLKTAANQAVFEITFFATLRVVYPTGQDSALSEVTGALAGFDVAVSDQFASDVDIDTALSRVTFRQKFQGLVERVRSVLKPIADTNERVRTQFEAVSESITGGIDELIGEPATLAFQTSQLVRLPALAATDIRARFDGYVSVIESSLSSGDGSRNGFQSDNLFAAAAMAGLISAGINTQFQTRPEAISYADSLLSQLDSLTAWRDDQFDALGQIDTGGSFQALQSAVAIAAGFLVQLSFSLAQERAVVLDRARTVVDLCAELYGGVDDFIEYLIVTNDLTGDEILELPRGRRIVYYI